MPFYWLVLGILAVWRVAHLLNAEDGPWGLLVGVRRLAGKGFWGEVLDCFYRLTLWIAVPFGWFLGASWPERLTLWLALSGAASLLERGTSRMEVPPAIYTEEKENDDVLRQESDAISRRNP